MSSSGATLTACNGGATGILKDIQRRLSSSGILPGLKQEAPTVVLPPGGISSPTQQKPYKLQNYATQSEAYDKLHENIARQPICQGGMCLGSVMQNPHLFTQSDLRTKDEVFAQAKDFIYQYYTTIKRLNTPAHKNRLEQIQHSIYETGTYQLTETELTFGAKVAWRNAPRCIGRIQWSKLQVFDCRQVTTTTGMFEALCNHIKYSTNKGNIRSAITIFPQRTDGKHDFRIWNQQLISYAGYKNPDGTITGDPISVEFTEFCMKLGWKGKGTKFDILPLILQANGHDPDYFDLPADLVLEVHFSHPSYPWFEEMGYKWYAVPAVSGMMLDCGGLQFTAAPFNGWYMGTEIGCRDLCDHNRYNILEEVATKLGFDPKSGNASLWKDRALVEVNVAVLHSFQKANVTIVDHHTASESFIKHWDNEQRLRNGCPADWVWIVPPMSGSTTPVFHQEMAMYLLKPCYEYQDSPWKTYVGRKTYGGGDNVPKKSRRKFHFKQLARAVKFTSKLFNKALSKRIKATILYATETGKSETFAKRLCKVFSHAFNAQTLSMDEYDFTNLEHEGLLLVVVSTAGNGDPPENGLEFAQNLHKLKLETEDDKNALPNSKSFIKMNSKKEPSVAQLERYESLRGSVSDMMEEDGIRPLSNVRFAVFGLGSSAYPNFCAFGKYMDNLLTELGGERLLKLRTGDEMCAQEQAFAKWAGEIFAVARDAFCLDKDDTFLNDGIFMTLTERNVRLVSAPPDPLLGAIAKCHNKNVYTCALLRKENLHEKDDQNGATILAVLKSNLEYDAGDHLFIYPSNRSELVDGILNRLELEVECDEPIQLQILKETHTPNGVLRTWEPHQRIPCCSIKTMFQRFLDITTPPPPSVLEYLAKVAKDEDEQTRLNHLATDTTAYEEWRHERYPHLLEVLEEFPSAKPKASLLMTQLSQLHPRAYSISSSPLAHPGEIHITVAVVTYKTQRGIGPLHYGVCSNYIYNSTAGDEMYINVKSAPSFHLPTDVSRPLILVGPGTGIAPFRGFWHHRKYLIDHFSGIRSANEDVRFGKIWQLFGCRYKTMDLYKKEKDEMVKEGVIDRLFLALSRESNIPKTYVQDLMLQEKSEIYKMVWDQNAHFYVCGDCTMAEHVYHTLKNILKELGNKTDQEIETYLLNMRDENRYHEDIFGITLRTAEVHSRSRQSAIKRLESSSS